jgi:site-specific DNA recombinase
MTVSRDLRNTVDMPSASSPTPSSAAVSYLRVSTADQAAAGGEAEGYSIPAQREANLRKAEALGATVLEEFVDRGQSARSSDRPELQRMLRYVREHPIEYVIVHKVDRLARNRVDDVEINLALRREGATLVSATENIDETPSGMLLHGIMSTIAEFYSRNLANEVNKGMTQKAKSGGTPGKAPIGYRNVRTITAEGREARTVHVDPTRAPLITWAFDAYATGDWTLRRLTAELQTRGLTNPPTPKLPARPIRDNHLHKILTNPYYKGDVVWRGVQHTGQHTPIVDKQTWAAVQLVLGAHANGEKQREHPHYLKSTVFCGSCGSRLIVTNATNRHGTTYPYFVCLARHQKTNGCTRKAVLIATVEERIEDLYRTVQLAPELQEGVHQLLIEEMTAVRTEADAEQRDLTGQRQRLINERAKLLQAHYAGAIPLDLLKTEQDRITQQMDIIESRLERTSADLDEVEKNLATAMQLAGHCHRAYLEAKPHLRRLFNQAFFTEILVDEDGVRPKMAEPFATMLSPELKGLVHARTNRVSSDHNVLAKTAGFSSTCTGRSPRSFSGEGLKGTALVPPVGFEPTLEPF